MNVPHIEQNSVHQDPEPEEDLNSAEESKLISEPTASWYWSHRGDTTQSGSSWSRTFTHAEKSQNKIISNNGHSYFIATWGCWPLTQGSWPTCAPLCHCRRTLTLSLWNYKAGVSQRASGTEQRNTAWTWCWERHSQQGGKSGTCVCLYVPGRKCTGLRPSLMWPSGAQKPKWAIPHKHMKTLQKIRNSSQINGAVLGKLYATLAIFTIYHIEFTLNV